MYRMNGDTIVKICEIVIARVDAIGFDWRKNENVELTLYIELTSEEQNAKPVVEKALEKMGYSYLGISNVVTTTYTADAEDLWRTGKDQETTDLK